MLNSIFDKFDNLIVFDLETTGIDYKRDEIIEVAALQVARGDSDFDVVEEFGSLVELSPNRKLPAAIIDLTGITDEQILNEGAPKDEICLKLADMLRSSNPLLAAYNAQFDLCFLYYFLNRFGMSDALKNVKMLDVLTVYKDRKPYPHKLSDAVGAYSIEISNSHRALDDVSATFKLLCEMGRELDDLENYVNLFGYNPKYGVSGPKISTVKYLPQGYDRRKKLYET